MELKPKFIKTTISYIKSSSKAYYINIPESSYESDLTNLLIKIFCKDILESKNICLLSSNEDIFNSLFPKLSNGLKLDTAYSIKHHKFVFNIFSKDLLKKCPLNYDMLVIGSYETFKPKHIIKLLKKSPNIKKVIIIGKNFDKTNLPYELRILNFMEFSFCKDHSSAYYNYFNSRLNDIK